MHQKKSHERVSQNNHPAPTVRPVWTYAESKGNQFLKTVINI